jgi:hypothetical protein
MLVHHLFDRTEERHLSFLADFYVENCLCAPNCTSSIKRCAKGILLFNWLKNKDLKCDAVCQSFYGDAKSNSCRLKWCSDGAKWRGTVVLMVVMQFATVPVPRPLVRAKARGKRWATSPLFRVLMQVYGGAAEADSRMEDSAVWGQIFFPRGTPRFEGVLQIATLTSWIHHVR